MTVRECYEQMLSFLPEKAEENVDMQKFMVAWCNVLLAETMSYENIFRRGKGLLEIEKVPVLLAEEEEIPYNEGLVRSAFPYGMARWAFRENEDIAGSREYYQLYAMALAEATPILETEVKDVYG